jgi:integrase
VTVAEFVSHLRAEQLSPRTIETYASFMERYLEAYSELTQESYDQWRSDAAEYSSSTIRQRVSCLSKYAELSGITIDVGRLPKMHKEIPVAVSVDDRDRIISVMRTERHRLAVLLMSELGLRVSEACSLRWDDVDMDRAELTVIRKGGAQSRLPILGDMLMPALRGALRKRKNEYVLEGINRKAVKEAVARAATKAGVEAHPHAFRHGFAVNSAKRGVTVAALSKMLGHKSMQTTMRYLDGLTMGVDELRGAFAV